MKLLTSTPQFEVLGITFLHRVAKQARFTKNNMLQLTVALLNTVQKD